MDYNLIVSIAISILSFILVLVNLYFNSKIKNVEQKIESLQEQHNRETKYLMEKIRDIELESNKIKMNYLNRFDDLKEIVNGNNMDIIKRLDNLNTKLEKQVAVCELTHNITKTKRR